MSTLIASYISFNTEDSIVSQHALKGVIMTSLSSQPTQRTKFVEGTGFNEWELGRVKTQHGTRQQGRAVLVSGKESDKSLVKNPEPDTINNPNNFYGHLERQRECPVLPSAPADYPSTTYHHNEGWGHNTSTRSNYPPPAHPLTTATFPYVSEKCKQDA